jgi:hypothetical protein
MVVAAVVMVVMTLVVALLPPLAMMMTVTGLLDDAACVAGGGHLAENVAGDRSGLRSAGNEEERACNGGEGEKFLHISSCSTAAIAAFILGAVDNGIWILLT